MGWYKLENDTHTCTIILACEHTNTYIDTYIQTDRQTTCCQSFYRYRRIAQHRDKKWTFFQSVIFISLPLCYEHLYHLDLQNNIK